MFDKISRLERKITGLEKEIKSHLAKWKKSKDGWVHKERAYAAEKELQKARSALILAKAEKSMKNKQIQSEIDNLQKEKNDLARRWVQSDDSDAKLKLDGQIQSLNKKIDKLENKLKKS